MAATTPHAARLKTTLALVVGLVASAALSACDQGGTQRTRTSGRPINSASGGAIGSASGGGNSGNPSSGGGGGGGGGLAPYLFTEADAAKITPLVKPLQLADEGQLPNHDPAFNALRDLIAEYFNEAMARPAASPGRNFRVRVARDEEPNAMALNENIVVHSGLLKIAGPLSLAMVLCHEVAHSTRNHSFEYQQELVTYDQKYSNEKSKLDAALDELLATSYVATTGKYTHRQADYNKVKPLWDAYWKALDIYNRRVESEADIVGGQLCSKAIGYTQTQVVDGFEDLFEAFASLGGSGGGSAFEPGEYNVPQAQLVDFLTAVYGRNTHPTDQERTAQIKRVKGLFEPNADKSLAQRWLTEYPQTIQGLTLVDPAAGLALTGASFGHGTGEHICQHGDHDPKRALLLDAVERATGGG